MNCGPAVKEIVTVGGAEVKKIREELGAAIGRRIQLGDLGAILGLAPKNARDKVRSWEDGSQDITGPAATALRLLRRLVVDRQDGDTIKEIKAALGSRD